MRAAHGSSNSPFESKPRAQRVAQEPTVHEILIFANDDGVLAAGAFPNQRVIRGLQPQIEDVNRVMALTRDPARQHRRELRVNEKVHPGCNTAWSAWRAA